MKTFLQSKAALLQEMGRDLADKAIARNVIPVSSLGTGLHLSSLLTCPSVCDTVLDILKHPFLLRYPVLAAKLPLC